MARGGFDYREFEKLADSVKKMEKDGRKFIEDFLVEMALRVMAKTKKRTPVDTGDLRNKWYLSGVAWGGNDVMINIVNSALYASFVEYGHWQQVGRFVPGHWEGAGDDARFIYEPGAEEGMILTDPWVDGRFMATLSIQEIEREMPRRLERAWANYARGKMGV